MARLRVGDTAPDFSLPDHEGRVHTLSELTARGHVLVVFNIGFV